jgi:tetratricopeptide (TPR) repeat protein
MHMTRRFAIAFGVLVCAAVIILGASRELRRTAGQQVRALGFIAENRPFGFDQPTNPTQLVPSREVRRSWQWRAYQGIEFYSDVASLEKARDMAPASVRQALLCQLAIAAAVAMQLQRPEMYIGDAFPPERFPPPNLEMAAKTIRYASEAWKAEPDNALYPQLLTAAYLAQRRDAQALAMLERAARLPDWNDHRREAETICVEALLLAGGTRALSKMLVFPGPYRAVGMTYQIAGTAGGLAYEARQAGDHALAVRWYRAAYAMVDPIMRSANSWYGIRPATYIQAQIVRALAASLHLRLRRGRPHPGESVQEGLYDLLLLYNLYDYLTVHGERGLATKVLLEDARSQFALSQQYYHVDQPEWNMWLPLERLQSYWVAQVWAMLALLISAAATALVGVIRMPRRLGLRRDGVTSPGLIAIRVILVVVPIVVMALALPMAVLLLSEASGRVEMLSPRNVASLVIVLFLLLLLAGTALVEAWRSRRPAVRETPFRARWMGSIRMVLPRVVAAFLLFYLLMFIPVSIVGAQLERQVDRVMREGDLPPHFQEQLFPPGLR